MNGGGKTIVSPSVRTGECPPPRPPRGDVPETSSPCARGVVPSPPDDGELICRRQCGGTRSRTKEGVRRSRPFDRSESGVAGTKLRKRLSSRADAELRPRVA